MANVLERLTEGTVFQDKKKESAALVSKWENSGLLEGIEDEYQRGTMAVLLENQAKELLREANTMSSGDVQGFAAVAFPIVRRVFAGLIANDLVSVQPMSLPSGLVFFMDFRRSDSIGNTGDSVFGTSGSLYGDRVGVQLTAGVRVDGVDHAEKGYFALANGYNKARYHSSLTASDVGSTIFAISGASDANLKSIRWDPDLVDDVANYPSAAVLTIPLASLANYSTFSDLIAVQDVFSVSVVTGSSTSAAGVGDKTTGVGALGGTSKVVRRLTVVDGANLKVVVATSAGSAGALLGTGASAGVTVSFPVKDKISSVGSSALGALKAEQPWTLEASSELPEINLKVDSFSITARSRKLKAAWTPELGQDLNAYHNLDAEVELTSILSEQIGLEIDQEILNDLIKGQTGGVKYWSRRPGKFVNRNTGADLGASIGSGDYVAPPDFTGNVSMWYETLIETINDVSANIHRKTLRGGANFVVCSPEVANILEFTAGFRATVTHDAEKGSIGAVKVGALNSKFDVIVDPYFPRNIMLVGRKGGSFLESGYVYSPYVPLQTSPTIFDPDNFTPRKAVMTRYGKAMVRPDMYGLVICQDLNG